MKYKKYKDLIITGFIICIISISMIFGSFFFIESTVYDANEQNKQYLIEIAMQNANIVKNFVESELNTLISIVNLISNETDCSTDSIMRVLKLENKRINNKRFGFIPPDGNAITTDLGLNSFNLIDREFFVRAINGECNISDKIIDKKDGKEINVYAVPLYKNDKVIGVVFATYSTDIFSQLLNINPFSGAGFSYIIKQDGTPVIYSDNKNAISDFDNMFNVIEKKGENDNQVNEMRNNIKNSVTNVIEYDIDGVERLSAYSKIGINDWYLISTVPKHIIFGNTNNLIARNISAVLLVNILFDVLIICIVYINFMNRNKLENIAFVDQITKGKNFNSFRATATEIIKKNEDKILFMICIDIDNFKVINDLYGFDKGDTLLYNINELLNRMTLPCDSHGHINNDDFIILLNRERPEEVVEFISNFIKTFNSEYLDVSSDYTVNFSSGIYQIQPKDLELSKIINRTYMAHRNAKKLNKSNKYYFYNDKIRNEAVKLKVIEDTMLHSLENGEFVVYLQPKCEIKTGKIAGAEALIRWIRSGVVTPPLEFMPIFEKNGFVVDIDMYVLEQVCKLQRKWLDSGIIPKPISVNQSKLLITDKDYVKKIYSVIKKYNIPPKLIELEILESLIHDNIQTLINVITSLRALGFLICIDDFGSGYSSLNMLKDINADVLKIDKEFLIKAENNSRGEFVLANTIGLAKGLNMDVVTEGVETQMQANLLLNLGCEIAQGYLYARPMPVDEFENKFIENKFIENKKL